MRTPRFTAIGAAVLASAIIGMTVAVPAGAAPSDPGDRGVGTQRYVATSTEDIPMPPDDMQAMHETMDCDAQDMNAAHMNGVGHMNGISRMNGAGHMNGAGSMSGMAGS